MYVGYILKGGFGARFSFKQTFFFCGAGCGQHTRWWCLGGVRGLIIRGGSYWAWGVCDCNATLSFTPQNLSPDKSASAEETSPFPGGVAQKTDIF